MKTLIIAALVLGFSGCAHLQKAAQHLEPFYPIGHEVLCGVAGGFAGAQATAQDLPEALAELSDDTVKGLCKAGFTAVWANVNPQTEDVEVCTLVPVEFPDEDTPWRFQVACFPSMDGFVELIVGVVPPPE